MIIFLENIHYIEIAFSLYNGGLYFDFKVAIINRQPVTISWSYTLYVYAK